MPHLLRLLALLFFCVPLGAASVQGAAGNAPPVPLEEAQLRLFNRNIVVFRSNFLGASADTRAQRAHAILIEAIQNSPDLKVAIKDDPNGKLVMVGGSRAFVMTPGDIDPLVHPTIEEASQEVRERLALAIAEAREARSAEAMLKALGLSALATLLFLGLLMGVGRLRDWITSHLLAIAARRTASITIGGTQVVDEKHLLPVVQRLFDLVRWTVVAILSYEWISYVLARFPYTRAWSERLDGYLVGLLEDLTLGIVGAIPGLGVAFAIFMLAKFSTNFLSRVLERLSLGQSGIGWLAPDTMPTTRRLFTIAIWLFALAMAYPYLPGSHTEAFRGLSVLLGLMISLGASSVVGQGAAGLILTYTRTIRAGEYVRIGDHEGTVTAMGMFTTTIRTGLGEELTIPNSLITGSVTKNYSRAVLGNGYVVDTTVTIGYDTPWRQVEAMLLEAARRTPGILQTPAPRVFQTALSDYYPEYRLVAQAVPGEPRPRAEVLSVLHARIQDVFSEHGVQIMSPHYMSDPPDAKLVKPEDWYPAPAKRE